MELDMQAARQAAEEAATAAQAVISDFLARGDWNVTLKSDQSPVTEVDVAAEQAIKSVLTSAPRLHQGTVARTREEPKFP